MTTELLLRSRRPWPWGLVIVADVDAPGGGVPDTLDDQLAVGTRHLVACSILHAIDGVATAEVVLGDAPEGFQCVYEGMFDVSSGQIELGDAARETVETAAIPAGEWRIRVHVDDRMHTEHVVVRLTPST